METLKREINLNNPMLIRCQRVIHGCTNILQLESARKYCDLYLNGLPRRTIVDELFYQKNIGFLVGCMFEHKISLKANLLF